MPKLLQSDNHKNLQHADTLRNVAEIDENFLNKWTQRRNILDRMKLVAIGKKCPIFIGTQTRPCKQYTASLCPTGRL